LLFLFFGSVRQIKLAIRQLFGALKHSLSYRISYISYIVSYRKDVVTKQDKARQRAARNGNATQFFVLCVASRCVAVRHAVSLFAATCRSVTQYAAICRSVPHVALYCGILRHTAARCGKNDTTYGTVTQRNAPHRIRCAQGQIPLCYPTSTSTI